MHNKSVASNLMSTKSKSTADAEDKQGKVRSDSIRNGKVTKNKSERIRVKEPSINLPKVGIHIKEIHSNFPHVVTNCTATPISDKSNARKACKPRIRSRKSKTVSSTVNQINSQTSLNTPKRKPKSKNSSSLGHLEKFSKTKQIKAIKKSQNAINNTKLRPNKNSGFITCLVCNRTKYYSHVQRRYGIFSCEPCFKFFSRYIKEPRPYICSNEEKCVILVESDSELKNAGTRCKSCWLKLCLESFRVSAETKKKILSTINQQTKKESTTEECPTETEKVTVSATDTEKSLVNELSEESTAVKDNPDRIKENSLLNNKIPLSEGSAVPPPLNITPKSPSNAHDRVSPKENTKSHIPSESAEICPVVKITLEKEKSVVIETKPEETAVVLEKSDPIVISNQSTLSSTSGGVALLCATSSSSSSSCSLSSSSSNSSSSSSTSSSSSSMSPQSEKCKQSSIVVPVPTYGNSLHHFDTTFYGQSGNKIESSNQVSSRGQTAPSASHSQSNPFLSSKSPNGYSFKSEENNFVTGHENSNSNRSSVATSSDSTSDSIYRETVDRKSEHNLVNFDSGHCMLGMQSGSDYGSYKDTSKLMNGKKSRCKECEGCRAQDCGQCTYCLDKKKFGGQNVIKQACKFRICIRFKNTQKCNQIGSPSPNAVSCGSGTHPSPMSPPNKHKAQGGTKHVISSGLLGKSTCTPAIQSPSFYPTPPPHCNSQHNSPNSVASSGQPLNHMIAPSPVAHMSAMSNTLSVAGMSNYGSPMCHLSSLPTPTTSPLSQNSMTNQYHPKSVDLAVSLCDYPQTNYQHYTSFGEHAVPNNNHCFESSNSLTSAAVCNYAACTGSYENDHSQQYNCNPHNYYPTVSDLNINYKMNNTCWPNDGTKNEHSSKGMHASSQYGQNAPNEYGLSSSFNGAINNSHHSNSYKNNGLYFGEYSSGQSSKNNWHASTYPVASNHYQLGTTPAISSPSTLSRYPFTSKSADQGLGNSFYGHQQNLPCHTNYYDGYY